MALVVFQWTDEQPTNADAEVLSGQVAAFDEVTIVSKTVALDCSVNETHGASAQVTEHQVERGSDISDHIRPMPKHLTIEGFITNTPIGTANLPSGITGQKVNTIIVDKSNTVISIPLPVVVHFNSLQFSAGFDRVRTAYVALVDAMLAGRLFRIGTSLVDYENMAATMITVPRNADTGDALRFTIDFQELRFAETETVAVTARQKKVDQGTQVPKTATEEEKAATEQSTAAAIGFGPSTP